MKKGFVVFRYEFFNLLKNRVFKITTIVLVLIIALVLSGPRLLEAVQGDPGEDSAADPSDGEQTVMALTVPQGYPGNALRETLTAAFPDREVVLTQDRVEDLEAQVEAEEIACAVVLEDALNFQYIVKTSGLYDSTPGRIESVLVTLYQSFALAQSGVDAGVAQQILSATAHGEVLATGNDQGQSYFYTFAMIMILYMAILMYGQLIVAGVATEKTSRAMELLITSAKPTQLIFGKVVGIGSAALTQLIAIGGTVLIFYPLNRSYWGEDSIIRSVFGISPALVAYMILFFLLGFFLYAFLLAAFASLASKMEDVNTLVMPVNMIFILAFLVTVISMAAGDVDSTVMKVCSFIPFTSPMAMFTRITMGEVAGWEIALSVAILLISNVVVCILSAKIYKVGVLLYGSRPKLREVFRMLRNS